LRPRTFGVTEKGCNEVQERTSDRAADYRRQDVKETEDDCASRHGVGSGDLELEEVETGETLHRGSARDRVVAGALTWRGPTRALSYVQRNRDGGTIELIREFGTAQREPSNHQASELDGEAVRVESIEGRSGSGEHRRGSFRDEGRD
jgi:hypothetical protein